MKIKMMEIWAKKNSSSAKANEEFQEGTALNIKQLIF